LIVCWALYDLANQFFALNVISVYFPRWLTLEKGAPEIFYSVAFAASMIIVGICAPLAGTISDIQRRKKIYLIIFTLLSVVFTLVLGFIDNVYLALVCFVVANFGCQIAIVFYNALMVDIAPSERMGLVSGIGRMFAYAGAILALYWSKPIIIAYGYSSTFILTAAAFFLFALPAMIFLKEESSPAAKSLRSLLNRGTVIKIYVKIRQAFAGDTQFKEIRLFLLAFFFCLCALQTMTLFMSIYASEVFGLGETQVIDLIIYSTVFAVIGSVVSGALCDRFGNKNTMIGVFALWMLALLGGAFLAPPFQWVLGAMIGFALSSTWVVARAWAVHLVPKESIGEIFGLFNLVGYVAGVVGPLFWGMMTLWLASLGVWKYRLSLLSLTFFIALAFYFLLKIPRGIRRNA